jgi:hypothetical protein
MDSKIDLGLIHEKSEANKKRPNEYIAVLTRLKELIIYEIFDCNHSFPITCNKNDFRNLNHPKNSKCANIDIDTVFLWLNQACQELSEGSSKILTCSQGGFGHTSDEVIIDIKDRVIIPNPIVNLQDLYLIQTNQKN